MNERPTHIDLFSGIGGFSLAFEREGFQTIGFSEIDPYACAVLRKHWPSVPNYGDISQWHNPPPCDVLTGGPPCQPISIAGRRKGASDHRYLWPAMFAVVRASKPDWVIVENPTHVKNMVLSDWWDDLEREGYQCQAFGIPACAVGSWQISGQRIWLVGAANGVGRDTMQEVPLLVEAASRATKGQEPGRWSIREFRGSSGRIFRAPDTAFGGVDSRLPEGLDRLRCLGNAIVPQIAQVIARAIYQTLTYEK